MGYRLATNLLAVPVSYNIILYTRLNMPVAGYIWSSRIPKCVRLFLHNNYVTWLIIGSCRESRQQECVEYNSQNQWYYWLHDWISRVCGWVHSSLMSFKCLDIPLFIMLSAKHWCYYIFARNDHHISYCDCIAAVVWDFPLIVSLLCYSNFQLYYC